MAIQHTLLYFSGVSDDKGMGAKLLEGVHGQEVLSDMEVMLTKSDETKIVAGFGGTLARKKEAVQAALNFLKNNHDARGKLVIYGYSAGGINSLDLCRTLKMVGQEVDLLVTVDVSAVTDVLDVLNPLASFAVVDRKVPMNVRRNRNYFQTDAGVTSFSKAAAGPATGHGVENINCDHLSFENIAVSRKTRHGQMQDLTRHKARQDMVIELNRN